MTPARPAPTGAITIVSDAAVTIVHDGAPPRPGPEAGRPRGPEAAIAAWLPPIALLLLAVPVIVAVGLDSLGSLVSRAGLWGLITAGAAGAGAIFAGLLLYLAGRGVRVPVLFILLFAALPWVASSAGAFLATEEIVEAAGAGDVAERTVLVAGAVDQILRTRALGTLATMALMAATAFALAFAAVGRRGVGRRSGAWVLGFIAALAVPGVTGFFLRPLGLELLRGTIPLAAGVLPLVSLAGMFVLCIAAAAAGSDEPHRRSAALAAATPLALGLAYLAALTLTANTGTMRTFGALAMVSPADRLRVAARAALELEPLVMLARFGWAATLVPVLALGVWALIRARPSVGRILGAVLALAFAAAVVHADQYVMHIASHAVGDATAPPWEELDSFEPAAIPLGDAVESVDAWVLPGKIVPRAGKPVALGKDGPKDPAALATLFGTLLGDAGKGPAESAKAPPPAAESPPSTDAGRPSGEPALTLGIDRRVAGATLKAVLDATAAAGARAVRLAGEGSFEVDDESRDAIRANLPLVGAWSPPMLGVLVLLAPALPPGYADADLHLLHGAVAADPAVKMTSRVSDSLLAIALPPEPEDPDAARLMNLTDAAGGPAVAYLALGPDATAGALAGAADRAAALKLLPLVVTGPVPGHPEGPASLPADVIVGSDPRSPGERVGSLDKETIRTVVRSRSDAVKLCYEKAVSRAPALAGNLRVTFEIAASGKVGKASIDPASTLEDPDVEKCVLGVVKKLVFPKPDGGPVTVTYPFAFATSG